MHDVEPHLYTTAIREMLRHEKARLASLCHPALNVPVRGKLLFIVAGRWRRLLVFALFFRMLVRGRWATDRSTGPGPITAAVVIAAGIAGSSKEVGIERGLHKVAEVILWLPRGDYCELVNVEALAGQAKPS